MDDGLALAAEPRIAVVRAEPCEIVRATSEELGIGLAQLCSPRRSPVEVFARQVAIRCAAALGVTGAQIAGALGLSQQGASAIYRRGSPAEVVAISAKVLARLGG